MSACAIHRGGRLKTFRAIIHGAIAGLLATSVAWQAPLASDRPASVIAAPTDQTMVRIVPYPDEMPGPGDVPACYRIGRCSAYDLYFFRDRPNRLTRLAPEAPPEERARSASIHYQWVSAPVTPEENILPKYRTASQVRDEYRAVGSPIEGTSP